MQSEQNGTARVTADDTVAVVRHTEPGRDFEQVMVFARSRDGFCKYLYVCTSVVPDDLGLPSTTVNSMHTIMSSRSNGQTL